MLPRLYPILDTDLCRERRLEPLAVLAAITWTTGDPGIRLYQLAVACLFIVCPAYAQDAKVVEVVDAALAAKGTSQ